MTRIKMASAFACGLMAACSSSPTTQSGPLPPVSQSLTLSGPVSGTLTSASSATCSIDTKGEITQPFKVEIYGKVKGSDTHIELRVDAYLGPGSYAGENFAGLIDGFSITKGTSDATDSTLLKASMGTITVVKGGTGSVDMTSGSQALKGNWRCR
jgi:hypothetical protein